MIRLTNANLEDFELFYQIYCEVFPENERKSYEKIYDLISGETYQLVCAYDDTSSNHRPVGYVCLLIGQYIWLDYLFINPQFQGRGYGGHIIDALLEAFQLKAGGIFLEVEKINALDENTQRRVDFYLRLGAFATTLDYQLPTCNGGLPMDLFYFPLTVAMPSMQACLNAIQIAFEVIHSDLKSTSSLLKWITAKNKNRICERRYAQTDSIDA